MNEDSRAVMGNLYYGSYVFPESFSVVIEVEHSAPSGVWFISACRAVEFFYGL